MIQQHDIVANLLEKAGYSVAPEAIPADMRERIERRLLDVVREELASQPPREWRNPIAAQKWAISVGACRNQYEARNSWLKVVRAHNGFGPHNAQEVYRAYYRRQLEKLGEVENAH